MCSAHVQLLGLPKSLGCHFFKLYIPLKYVLNMEWKEGPVT